MGAGQFTGNSLSQWLPMDIATQNLILHSMDLIGLNRIAGCARIRISRVSQQCNWEPGRGQIGEPPAAHLRLPPCSNICTPSVLVQLEILLQARLSKGFTKILLQALQMSRL